MKNVLITGANGFVGKNLSWYLNQLQYTVLNAYRLAVKPEDLVYGDLDADFQPEINFQNALKKCDTVVHLAAKVHIMNKKKQADIQSYKKANTEYTINLAKLAKASGVKKFIFISTIKVNGESTINNQAFTADDICSPADPYAISKFEAEKEIIKLHTQNEFSVIIIRPPLIYGPHVKGNFKKLISLVKLKIPLPYLNIKNSRSLLSVFNLCDLICNCIQNPNAISNAHGQIFLASDNLDLSLKGILSYIAEAFETKLKLIQFPQFITDLVCFIFKKNDYFIRLFGNLQVDITKTKNTLSWTPPYTFKESLLGINKIKTLENR